MKTFAIALMSLIVGVLAGGYAATAHTVSNQSIERTVLEIPSDQPGAQPYTVPVPDHVTARQSELLAIAYDTAKADGLRYPQLLQGIVLQESQAGGSHAYKVGDQHLPTNKRSYGVGQVKLETARAVLKRYPTMWDQYEFQTRTDEEVIAKLIDNDRFNIAVASKYLMILKGYGYTSPHSLAVAYNKGPGGAAGTVYSSDPYAMGVMKHIHMLPAPKVEMSGTYHVQNGDSLSKIAMALKVTAPVERVMDAIFAANPKAFIGGDRNLLMANVDLVMPAKLT